MFGDLGGVGAILSVILGLGSLVSVAAVALMRANQTTLRETNNDLRNQLGDIKAARAEEQAECAKEHAENQTRIAELEADNAALQRVVTGEVHWVALSQRIEDLIALVMALKDNVTRLLKDTP